MNRIGFLLKQMDLSILRRILTGGLGKMTEAGVALVNEVGLDPGIDNLMAHALIDDYRGSDAFDPKNHLSFISYCGGVPKIPNAFRYKFSWSPLGVLRALQTPARCIRRGETLDITRPWDAITEYRVPGETVERFEAYPNRDSLPFVGDYGFDQDWQIEDFVRGTLRLEGWSQAWSGIFEQLEALDPPGSEQALTTLSEQLWADYAYADDEADRVVLCVELEAESPGGSRFHEASIIDAVGRPGASAMARLVSLPVMYATETVLAGVPGWHGGNQAGWLEHTGLGLQPDPAQAEGWQARIAAAGAE